MSLSQLYKTLSQRKRPEDVAEMILAILDERLSPAIGAIVKATVLSGQLLFASCDEISAIHA